MKRIIFFILLITTTKPGITQSYYNSKYFLGLELGPTLSLIYGNSFITSNRSPGLSYNGGITFQVNFNKTFSFRACGSYERKIIDNKNDIEFTDDLGNVIGTGTYQQKYDYLVFPFLARAYFGNKVKFFVNLGPSFNYLIQGKGIVTITDLTDSDSTIINNIDEAKKIDIVISLGTGCEIKFTQNLGISLEARNNLGLLPILKSDYGNVRFNTTSILIGFFYGLK